jgi:hypothetical protein
MRAARTVRKQKELSPAEVAMLECGFDLNGGSGLPSSSSDSHVARRAAALSRTISDYDPRSDPHLLRFWRARGGQADQLRPRSRSAASANGGARVDAGPAKDEQCVNGPVSANHVLGLKRVFARFASEITCCGCTSEGGCTAACAGVARERLQVLPVSGNNVHAITKFGVNVSNHYRRLSQHPPLTSSFSEERVATWLDVLGCHSSIDWPSFLLLCSADIQRDLDTLRKLKQARTAFLAKRRVSSESDYHDLLAFMHFSHSAHDSKCASFFQSGDFYRARHACNFADTVFSLLPHRVQFYLHKANARGVTLSQNNCGHASIADTLGLSSAGTRPASAASRRKGALSLVGSNAKAVATERQAAAARRQAGAFV